MALPAGLLDSIKNNLNITWTDADTDANITNLAEDGMAYIDRMAGVAQDYTTNGSARALLFNYVLYGRSNAVDEFRVNYATLLKEFQIDREVVQYEAAAEAANTE